MSRTLGRYEDRGLLGEGASGQVRRVWDETLARTLAMKVLRPELATNPLALRSFEAEARVLARLQHPGIVPIHEIGRLADGRPYYTMKEVHGPTLRDVLREVHASPAWPENGWTLRRLVGACHFVAVTVGYAHAAGYVHRDLKPSNVMLGAFGEVLVLDWGLAGRIHHEPRLPEAGTDEAPRRAATASGSTQGTAAYMAPELVSGGPSTRDPRADTYSPGATIYEVLCG
jgi:serine/threonine-protein kinase